MLSLQNAGKRFGPRVLFLEANWLIRNKERTALVGANGAGKSTIMKVLAGLETLDYGSLQQTRGISIGYLPQEGLALTGRTVFEECLSVFDELREMAREVERLGGQLAVLDHAGPEYESAAERYSMLQERFHALDGYALDSQVGGVLTGLGFGKEDWSRQTDEFSGGWQMRIALARLLLAKPNLLLLDEPTNHLDLETRNWLEDYLRTYPFGYILISHDRYFLDVTIDRTVEIWNKRLNIYQGNYTKYLSQKDERRTQLQAAYRNQREQIEHLEAFINRFRYQATKAKQVQSRIKELEKIERIEIPEEESTIHFRFPQPPPSGRMVVEAEGLTKSYGPISLISKRSTESLLHPVLSKSLRKTPIGAVGKSFGAAAWVACATTRASGAAPRFSASSDRIMTSAAAPSEIELEFAAVTVPPSRNAAFSVGILSGRAFGGCSSVATSVSLLPALTLTPAISQANAPSLIARLARSSELSA